jgi:ATP-binding cassette subfamily F protein 3
MFGGEASDKKVKVLSGGERSRLAMIRLLLEPVNLLILDEPTNHLDMRSKDVLKSAIKDFDGTVILVSHDREFLNGLVTKVYEFGNQKVREHLGGIYEFLQYKKMDSLRELEAANPSKSNTDSKEKQLSDNKLSYEARKEIARKKRKAEKDVEEAERAIAVLEKHIADMEMELQNEDKAADNEFLMLYQKNQRTLEQKMYEWEILCEALKEFDIE